MTTLYVSDLDGTLLRSDATLSSNSRNALRTMLRDGLRFTLASARSVSSMRNILCGLELTLPVIEFNGAFLSDLETGRHEIVNAIEPDVVFALDAQIRAAGGTAFLSTFDGRQDSLYCERIANPGMEWYHADRLRVGDERLRPLQPLRDALHENVVCFTVIGLPSALRDLEASVNACWGVWVETHLMENQYSPGWHWLTIHDRRATKDQAIRLLRDRYTLTQCELVVFGDQSNDLKMFAAADRSIAVANAASQVRQCATTVIGSSEEDSVVNFLRTEWTNRNTTFL